MRGVNIVTLDWNRLFPVWWSFIWRMSLYVVICSLILGAILGGIASVTGHLDQAAFIGTIGAYVSGVPASMLALKQALKVHLGSLASMAANASAQTISPP
jgi:hypothetical protein